MTWYPYNPAAGQELQTDIPGVRADRAFLAHLCLSAEQAAAADAAGVLAAVTDTGEPQEITEGLSAPFYPRNITATAGGVAGDIKAIQVVIEGEDMAGNVISETLPAFTENTAGIVAGSKAFKIEFKDRPLYVGYYLWQPKFDEQGQIVPASAKVKPQMLYAPQVEQLRKMTP